MKDMFDMTAGTSTGSIISAALAYPDKDHPEQPQFFAKDIISIYSDRGGEIFAAHGSRYGLLVVLTVIFVGGLGFAGYQIGCMIYMNEKKEDEYKKLQK